MKLKTQNLIKTTHAPNELQTPQHPNLSANPDSQFADLSYQSISKYLRSSYIALFGLVIGIGGWAAISPIQGAVIASGQVAVDAEPQILQHLEGGVISEIYVKEGDYIEQNAQLMKLDATLITANKMSAETNYYANEALISRLQAEQNESRAIRWTDALGKNANNPAALSAMALQDQLFNARRSALAGQIGQLNQNIARLEDEDRGVMLEIRFTENELALISPELDKLQRLLERNLVPRARLTELQRQHTRLLNARAQLQNRRALIASSALEAQLTIDQTYKARREDVLSLLSDARTNANSFNENLKTADNREKHIYLRAPNAGFVHKMSIKTIGGVITPGQEIMQIIPRREKLLLSAQIVPSDLDQVSLSQPTNVVFSALNLDAPPELSGKVVFISANSLVNEKDGSPYYSVDIEVENSELSKLNSVKLVPGMPADIFIQTEKRTVMQYLLEPLRKTLRRTMRDG